MIRDPNQDDDKSSICAVPAERRSDHDPGISPDDLDKNNSSSWSCWVFILIGILLCALAAFCLWYSFGQGVPECRKASGNSSKKVSEPRAETRPNESAETPPKTSSKKNPANGSETKESERSNCVKLLVFLSEKSNPHSKWGGNFGPYPYGGVLGCSIEKSRLMKMTFGQLKQALKENLYDDELATGPGEEDDSQGRCPNIFDVPNSYNFMPVYVPGSRSGKKPFGADDENVHLENWRYTYIKSVRDGKGPVGYVYTIFLEATPKTSRRRLTRAAELHRRAEALTRFMTEPKPVHAA